MNPGRRIRTPIFLVIWLPSVLCGIAANAQQVDGQTRTSPPHSRIEAPGLRGLIDPGGYSAPAKAAAASGLIAGMADILRSKGVVQIPWAKNLPCSLESELVKSAAANPRSIDASRRLGEFYIVHGQASHAIPYLKHARQIDILDLRATLDLSAALIRSGEFDRARELLLGLPEKQHNGNYHRLLASAEEGTGQFAQAAEQYRNAAEEGFSEDDFFGMGYEFIVAGKPPEASKAFQGGMEHHPHSTSLLLGAASAKFLQGHSSEAINMFWDVADRNPSDPLPYSFLVPLVDFLGDQVDRVRAGLKLHVELAPMDAKTHYLYAVSLLHGKSNTDEADDNLAESLLEQAIVLNPNLTDAHDQLGVLYARHNNFQAAAREFETTLRLDPDRKEAHYRVAIAYKRLGRPEDAEREMKSFREARESGAAQGGDGGIAIEQFISVIDRPEQQFAHSEIQCSSHSAPPSHN